MCLLILSTSHASVELTYLPNRPVTQESHIHVKLYQSLPGIKIDASMDQRLAATLTIVDRSDLPVTLPPINMLFTMKKMQVDLESNGTKISYDVKSPETSLFLAEVNDIINKPVKLHFDENFQLFGDTPDISQLSKELPILGDLQPSAFINELFQHLFSLAGKQLEEGEVYTIEPSDESIGLPPKQINYTIKKIDEDTITAIFNGDIKEKKYDMDVEIKIGEDNQEIVGFSTKGKLTGEVSWNRKNALNYTLHSETNYIGHFNIASWEWLMEVSLVHDVTSTEGNTQL